MGVDVQPYIDLRDGIQQNKFYKAMQAKQSELDKMRLELLRHLDSASSDLASATASAAPTANGKGEDKDSGIMSANCARTDQIAGVCGDTQ